MSDDTGEMNGKLEMHLQLVERLAKLVVEHGLGELKIDNGDIEVQIKTKADNVVYASSSAATNVASRPAIDVPAMSPVVSASKPTIENEHVMKSPLVGVVYRRPSPARPNYAEEGSLVKAGDVLLTVEAMKIFNEVRAKHDCRIVRFLVTDGQPVEFDQPLVEYE